MTAKEMFENLGYKQRADCSKVKYANGNDEEIYFWLEDDTLSIFAEYSGESKYLTKDELKAIMVQAKELGWLDE